MNRAFSLVTGILAVLFISGCGSSSSSNTSFIPGVKNIPGVSLPSSASTLATVDQCLEGCKVLAGGTGMLSQGTCQDACWSDDAKQKKDVTICDTKISKEDGLIMTACKLSVAEATGDSKICDSIGTDKNDIMRGSCYMSLAKALKDSKICEGITGTILYEGCKTDAVSQ